MRQANWSTGLLGLCSVSLVRLFIQVSLLEILLPPMTELMIRLEIPSRVHLGHHGASIWQFLPSLFLDCD